MHANHAAFVLNHWDIHEPALMPVPVGVDITYLELEFALYQGVQRLDQFVTKMAALATVYLQDLQSAPASR